MREVDEEEEDEVDGEKEDEVDEEAVSEDARVFDIQTCGNTTETSGGL